MAEILFASSFDDKYSPQNVFVNNNSCWISTGLFPQEIFIQLDNEKLINSVSVSSCAVKRIVFESCENESAVNFVKQAEMNDVPGKESKQDFFINFAVQKPSKLIKITVLEAYDDFCAIFNITFK